MKSSSTLFTKDFSLVVIGQIISLFGNQILRFALPLYLLSVTNSPALFGIVSACSFLPMILLCPIGGIIADRVNKRNIMVILDLSTAVIILLLSILLGHMNIILLLLASLILLYGIQGAYQPAVQASIPALVPKELLMPGNAIINLVASLSGLIGPVIGGALFAVYGIHPILYISVICFLFSGIMELFIRIPFVKPKNNGNLLVVGIRDFRESLHFIKIEQPSIWKVSLTLSAINLFLSAAIIIGLPIIVTGSLGFDTITANRLYGYAQGVIGIGSLIGGLLAGAISHKLKVSHSPILLILSGICMIPIGVGLHLPISSYVAYGMIVISCVCMMAFAAMFTIQMMSVLQLLTPAHLVGKVISCAICISMCASPIGQALYGGLFEYFSEMPYVPFYFASMITLLICIGSFGSLRNMQTVLDQTKKKAQLEDDSNLSEPDLIIN